MAMASKRIVLATIGSLGDLHPCIALAIELRSRGHRPVIASSEIYRSKVESLGFPFHGLRPNVPARDPMLIRNVMDMKKGPEFLLRQLILPSLRETYEDLAEALRGADLLMAGEIVFAAPIAAEKLRTPWVSVILSPFSFLSAHDPSISPLAPSWTFLRKAGVWPNRLFLSAGKLATQHWWAPVRRLRGELGIGPGSNPLFHDKFSTDLTLALFSRQLAVPQPDWPQNTVQTGFVFYDRDELRTGLSGELEGFLSSGEPPIVFTRGSSAVHDPRGFFEESARAASLLGRRAVLLTGENPPPAKLSRAIHCEPYAPHSELFPRAAAVVHQGGSGTTAQALRAGRPALIMPCAFDQPDNAARVERLGVSLTIARHRYKSRTAVPLLARLLDEPRFSATAQASAEVMQGEDGVSGACDAVERVLASAESRRFGQLG
jgi:rhamnosyltransferase subunit B